MEKLRILIADNLRASLELYSAVFVAVGYSVRCATTGHEALAAAMDFRPDAVFTSIIGADKNGLNLCMTLRDIPATAAALIVAISPYGKPRGNSEIERGYDYFFVRPVDLNKILGTMKHLDGYKGNTVPPVRVPL